MTQTHREVVLEAGSGGMEETGGGEEAKNAATDAAAKGGEAVTAAADISPSSYVATSSLEITHTDIVMHK
jgi:hypothetical protein